MKEMCNFNDYNVSEVVSVSLSLTLQQKSASSSIAPFARFPQSAREHPKAKPRDC